jgi:hypothetical protein
MKREKPVGGIVDFLSVASATKPRPKISGGLAAFVRITRPGHPDLMPIAEEAAMNAERRERRRKAQKRVITITVGTVEAIDVEVVRLKALGFGVNATRDKVIDAALTTLRGR